MDRDVDEVLRRAIELEYEAMRHHRHHAKDESIAAWERAMALFRDDFAFATRHLTLFDRGYELLKSSVADCAEWPGPAKALADAAILRSDIETRRL